MEKDRNINIRVNRDSGEDEGPAQANAAEEGKKSEAEMAKALVELEDLRQTMLRRQADFENYKKRIERERTEDSKRTMARLIESLIPVVDGFEHALAAHREAEYESYRKGFEIIYRQLLDQLAKLGAERIEPLGQQFDPHSHQAVDRAETEESPDGTILQVYQPGYVFHGRVLRPAMVQVAVSRSTASNRTVN